MRHCPHRRLRSPVIYLFFVLLLFWDKSKTRKTLQLLLLEQDDIVRNHITANYLSGGPGSNLTRAEPLMTLTRAAVVPIIPEKSKILKMTSELLVIV